MVSALREEGARAVWCFDPVFLSWREFSQFFPRGRDSDAVGWGKT